MPALATFAFEAGEDSRALMTLFTQAMLEHGYLAGGTFYPTCAHTPEIVQHYLEAADTVFGWLREQCEHGTVRQALRGPVAHAGFARLT